MDKIPYSVCILTFNSGDSLDKTLISVKDFSEIIINDGGSKDNTLEIAKNYNCKIISQDVKFKNSDGSLADFSGVKNQMIDVAKYSWVLMVDSDEYVSKELVDYIRHLDQSKKNILYNIARKYIVANQIIKHSSTYPNYQIRLFNKSLNLKYIKPIHEKLNYSNEYKVEKVNQPFYVAMPDFIEFKRKGLKYLNMQLNMWDKLTFKQWFKWVLIFHLRASLGYALRLFLLQFKVGKKLPLNYELFQIYYNFLLIFKSLKLINKFK